jgi:hypothetical protein
MRGGRRRVGIGDIVSEGGRIGIWCREDIIFYAAAADLRRF